MTALLRKSIGKTRAKKRQPRIKTDSSVEEYLIFQKRLLFRERALVKQGGKRQPLCND